MKKFVVVYANEQDALDVRVRFEEHEDLQAAYKANGLNEDGERGTGAAFCEYADEHEEGQETCEYCPSEDDDVYSVTIVLEVPPMGKQGDGAYYTNG